MSMSRQSAAKFAVKAASQWRGPPEYDAYPLTGNPRGSALIISNGQVEFPRREPGTHDAENLSSLFTSLGFKVSRFRNLGLQELMAALSAFAIRSDQGSCVVVAILSQQLYSVEKQLLQKFSNEECPALRGKPKIFIVQQSDRSPPSAMGHKSLKLEDMLVIYPQIDVRGTDSFISSFCRVITDHARDTDLREMLRMAEEANRGSVVDSFSFSKMLFFNPGVEKTPQHGRERLNRTPSVPATTNVPLAISTRQVTPADVATEKVALHPRIAKDAEKFKQLVESMGIWDYYQRHKIELNDVRQHYVESIKEIRDVPWFLLHKVLSLDYRSLTESFFPEIAVKQDVSSSMGELADFYKPTSRATQNHPMDILAAIFLSCSPLLQSIIVEKLFTCQISLPLMFPDPVQQSLIMFLGAMGNITCIDSKKNEAPITKHNCCIASFVGFGDNLPNAGDILNATVQKVARHERKMMHHTREQSNAFWEGMVDMAWFLPSPKEDNMLADITLFLNLRGEIQDMPLQWNILKKMSSIVVIMMSGQSLSMLCQKGFGALDALASSDSNTAILVYDKDKCLEGNLEKIVEMNGKWKSKGRGMVFIDNESKAPSLIIDIIKTYGTMKKSLAAFGDDENRNVIGAGDKLNFKIDAKGHEHCQGKQLAVRLTDCMQMGSTKDLKKTKYESLPVQMLWRDWVKLNKQLNRDIGKGNIDINALKADLAVQMHNIRKQQREKCVKLSSLMQEFLTQLSNYSDGKFSLTSVLYMLNAFKHSLDDISRHYLPNLYGSYRRSWFELQALKQKVDRHGGSQRHISQMEKVCGDKEREIADASMGLEHVIREMGQIYEVMCIPDSSSSSKFDMPVLANVMADLILSGQGIELLDGDASHVALKWVAAVLQKVEKKIGTNRKVFVLSVLGIQSSGKSTLLNTLFGLQFAVSAGRCTKGVYAQLIPACKEVTPKIDYILVIDTEGLRAPELGANAYMHDHEIATFVVGLGDLTIINMKGELASEMQDVLQIVIHAFLRISQAKDNLQLQGSCIFVHQNVSAVNAKEMNFWSQQKLQETLDKMTLAAAEHEKVRDVNKFNDVIKFDLTKHVLYFADLWLGDPPMASVNPGYSRDVQNLRKLVMENMNETASLAKSLTAISQKLSDLWKSILTENFVFSFKNSIEIRAYTALEKTLSKIKWIIEDKAMEMRDKAINEIESSHHGLKDLFGSKINEIREELNIVLNNELIKLDKFFSQSNEQDILEQWREKSKHVCIDEKRNIQRRIEEDLHRAISEQEEDLKQEDELKKYKEVILSNAKKLANQLERQQRQLTDVELRREFDGMWNACIKAIFSKLPKREDHLHVKKEIIRLTYDLHPTNNHSIDRRLFDKPATVLRFDRRDIELNVMPIGAWFTGSKNFKNLLGIQKMIYEEVVSAISKEMNLLFQNVDKAMEKHSKSAFELKRARELLLDFMRRMELMKEKHSKHFQLNETFCVTMTVYVASYLAPKFKKFHDQIEKKNDPEERLRIAHYDEYFELFNDIYNKSVNDFSAAKAYCQCLLPKMEKKMTREMPRLLADHVISNVASFHSKKQLERQVLTELLADDDFEKFYQYINDTTGSLKAGIQSIVEKELFPKKYAEIETLQIEEIIEAVSSYIQEVMKTPPGPKNISEFIDKMHDKLKAILPVKQTIFETIRTQRTVKDFQLFTESLNDCLQSLKEKLISDARVKDKFSLSKGAGSVFDLLFNKCIGCCEQCPFCKTQCSLTVAGHNVKHSCTQHMSGGLARMQEKDTDKLVVENCSTNAASGKSFSNLVTEGKYRLFKDYQQVYPNWSIAPDNSIETSAYWKFVFARYSAKFAQVYKAKEADIPAGWHDITAADALASLKN